MKPTTTWLDRISPQLHFVWHALCNQGWIEPSRRICDHELVVVTNGACKVTIEDRELICSDGGFVIVPPGALHVSRCDAPEGADRYCFHFDWAPMLRHDSLSYSSFSPEPITRSRLRPAPAWVPRRLLHGQMANTIENRDLLNRLFAASKSSDSSRQAACRGVLLELLLLLLSSSPRPAPAQHPDVRLARRARDLLSQHMPKDCSVQTLFASTGYSYAHVQRAFRRVYGITPLHYAQAMQVERAKVLLVDELKSIKQVACELGFQNGHAFARAFKQMTGQSPEIFRRRFG